MFNPMNLLPSSLGLAWGLSREQCIARLDGQVVRSGSTYTIMHLAFRDEAYDVVVHVASSPQEPGLNRLEIYLHRSRENSDGAVEPLSDVQSQTSDEAVYVARDLLRAVYWRL